MSRNLASGALLMAITAVGLYFLQKFTAAFFFSIGAIALGVAAWRHDRQ